MKEAIIENQKLLYTNMASRIDFRSYQFTSRIKQQFEDVSIWSSAALEWLMLEHYQFSFHNPQFLLDAAKLTMKLEEKGISAELRRNFEEEESHAVIYKKALFEIGINVEKRVEFTPTSKFLDDVARLITQSPYYTLGVMYATETAAIFEHEVFRDMSCELLKRRNISNPRNRLIAFHDMHLDGVEQAHKDNLGVFLNLGNISQDSKNIYYGACNAIISMTQWWVSLLEKAKVI